VKSEVSVTGVRALRAPVGLTGPAQPSSPGLTLTPTQPQRCPMPRAGAVLAAPKPALLPGWGRRDGLWVPAPVLALPMGCPTTAPGSPAHRELSALTAHQQADNIKVFFSNLPLCSYPHILNIKDTVHAYSSLNSCYQKDCSIRSSNWYNQEYIYYFLSTYCSSNC